MKNLVILATLLLNSNAFGGGAQIESLGQKSPMPSIFIDKIVNFEIHDGNDYDRENDLVSECNGGCFTVTTRQMRFCAISTARLAKLGINPIDLGNKLHDYDSSIYLSCSVKNLERNNGPIGGPALNFSVKTRSLSEKQ